MSPVGHVVSGAVCDRDFFCRIGQLLESDRDFDRFCRKTYDKRMSFDLWGKTLVLELLMLQRWCLKRFASELKETPNTSLASADEMAVVLLPRYGFSLHLLRRAVPLAVLGMQTEVSFPRATWAEAIQASTAVIEEFHLESTLQIATENSEDVVANAVGKATPVFVTGRKSTYHLLASRYQGCRIFGATGSCLVIVGSSEEEIRNAEQRFSGYSLDQSCSNHGLSLLCDGTQENSRVIKCWGSLASHTVGSTTLANELLRVHPSVVVSVKPGRVSDHSVVAGYTLWSLDERGDLVSREGFGKDPVAGWPGDYCV